MTEVKKREKKSFGSRQVSGPTHLVTCNKAGKLGQYWDPPITQNTKPGS
jgi:hypothetical protein